MTETGEEIQGTFASEIQKEGMVIGRRSDDNQTKAIIKDETIEIRIGQGAERMRHYATRRRYSTTTSA
jgi:hypothetical protein